MQRLVSVAYSRRQYQLSLISLKCTTNRVAAFGYQKQASSSHCCNPFSYSAHPAPPTAIDVMKTDFDTSAPSHLNGLLRVASLTNEELFPIVVATINKWNRTVNQTKKGEKDKKLFNWKDVALRVAINVAKGEDKCCCPYCWVAKYQEYSTNDSSNNDLAEMKLSFADALKTLDDEECNKKRLTNALDEISGLQPSEVNTQITIQQLVGLIRTSTHLSDSEETTSMQVQVLSHFMKLMPQTDSLAPNDIFLAIQQPILSKLSWDVFVKSGIKFASLQSESKFKSLLSLQFEATEADCDAQHVHYAGTKRKRDEQSNVESTENHDLSSITMQYFLEAAHLARNGNVRAQHGAIIYTLTADGTTQIIGKGWNHDVLLHKTSKQNKNKLNLHSEVHAVADALRTHGEDECFNTLFPKATIVIVELDSNGGYENSHPCPKCDPMLRAVGIPNVIHSSCNGTLIELKLGAGNIELMRNENVNVALGAACEEMKITCTRLLEG